MVTFNCVKAGLKNEMEADKHYGSTTNVVICPYSSKRVTMAVYELSTSAVLKAVSLCQNNKTCSKRSETHK